MSDSAFILLSMTDCTWLVSNQVVADCWTSSAPGPGRESPGPTAWAVVAGNVLDGEIVPSLQVADDDLLIGQVCSRTKDEERFILGIGQVIAANQYHAWVITSPRDFSFVAVHVEGAAIGLYPLVVLPLEFTSAGLQIDLALIASVDVAAFLQLAIDQGFYCKVSTLQ